MENVAAPIEYRRVHTFKVKCTTDFFFFGYCNLGFFGEKIYLRVFHVVLTSITPYRYSKLLKSEYVEYFLHSLKIKFELARFFNHILIRWFPVSNTSLSFSQISSKYRIIKLKKKNLICSNCRLKARKGKSTLSASATTSSVQLFNSKGRQQKKRMKILKKIMELTL